MLEGFIFFNKFFIIIIFRNFIFYNIHFGTKYLTILQIRIIICSIFTDVTHASIVFSRVITFLSHFHF
eukprot:UN26415